MKSLQYEFIETKGQPIKRGAYDVQQRCFIKVPHGTLEVTVRFLTGLKEDVGIRIGPTVGWVELSDGSHANGVTIWRGPDLSDEDVRKVECAAGELEVWNVYRVKYKDGSICENEWTGNAEMVVLSQDSAAIRFGCSSGPGDFNPLELIVEVKWRTCK
jgi:hypothetical protein